MKPAHLYLVVYLCVGSGCKGRLPNLILNDDITSSEYYCGCTTGIPRF